MIWRKRGCGISSDGESSENRSSDSDNVGLTGWILRRLESLRYSDSSRQKHLPMILIHCCMKSLATVYVAQSLHTELRSCSPTAMALHEREALYAAVSKRLRSIQASLAAMTNDGLEPSLVHTIEQLLSDAEGHARGGEGDFTSQIADLPKEYGQLEQALQGKFVC